MIKDLLYQWFKPRCYASVTHFFHDFKHILIGLGSIIAGILMIASVLFLVLLPQLTLLLLNFENKKLLKEKIAHFFWYHFLIPLVLGANLLYTGLARILGVFLILYYGVCSVLSTWGLLRVDVGNLDISDFVTAMHAYNQSFFQTQDMQQLYFEWKSSGFSLNTKGFFLEIQRKFKACPIYQWDGPYQNGQAIKNEIILFLRALKDIIASLCVICLALAHYTIQMITALCTIKSWEYYWAVSARDTNVLLRTLLDSGVLFFMSLSRVFILFFMIPIRLVVTGVRCLYDKKIEKPVTSEEELTALLSSTLPGKETVIEPTEEMPVFIASVFNDDVLPMRRRLSPETLKEEQRKEKNNVMGRS